MKNSNVSEHLIRALEHARDAYEHATDADAYGDDVPALARAPLNVAIGELSSVIRWLEAVVEADKEAA
jgi:hypothetical protein